jgi:hypothetical protein
MRPQLDGVDTRTLLLQKPLLELKGDLSALHEGVVSMIHFRLKTEESPTPHTATHTRSLQVTGMQAIQEKVKHRLEVSLTVAVLPA